MGCKGSVAVLDATEKKREQENFILFREETQLVEGMSFCHSKSTSSSFHKNTRQASLPKSIRGSRGLFNPADF